MFDLEEPEFPAAPRPSTRTRAAADADAYGDQQRAERLQAEMDALGAGGNASWGNQMRSYVLHPYQMVKDLRTGYEVNNPSAVFDGDLDGLIEAGIRWRKEQEMAEEADA